MRFDLVAKAASSSSFPPALHAAVLPKTGNLPLSITIKPANCCPGSFEYKTNSRALLAMLRDETDLNGYTLASFDGELHARATARIRGVDFNDAVLRNIGYFVD